MHQAFAPSICTMLRKMLSLASFPTGRTQKIIFLLKRKFIFTSQDILQTTFNVYAIQSQFTIHVKPLPLSVKGWPCNLALIRLLTFIIVKKTMTFDCSIIHRDGRQTAGKISQKQLVIACSNYVAY